MTPSKLFHLSFYISSLLFWIQNQRSEVTSLAGLTSVKAKVSLISRRNCCCFPKLPVILKRVGRQRRSTEGHSLFREPTFQKNLTLPLCSCRAHAGLSCAEMRIILRTKAFWVWRGLSSVRMLSLFVVFTFSFFFFLAQHRPLLPCISWSQGPNSPKRKEELIITSGIYMYF